MVDFQSFAGISKASTDQLQNLPGFGQVKVKNIKNAFEKPFRNNATTSLAVLASQAKTDASNSQSTTTAPPANRPPATSNSKSKGKERAVDLPPAATSSRPIREPSPVWDIELDNSSPTSETGPLPETYTAPSAPPVRAESPVWDIELDLN